MKRFPQGRPEALFSNKFTCERRKGILNSAVSRWHSNARGDQAIAVFPPLRTGGMFVTPWRRSSHIRMTDPYSPCLSMRFESEPIPSTKREGNGTVTLWTIGLKQRLKSLRGGDWQCETRAIDCDHRRIALLHCGGIDCKQSSVPGTGIAG